LWTHVFNIDNIDVSIYSFFNKRNYTSAYRSRFLWWLQWSAPPRWSCTCIAAWSSATSSGDAYASTEECPVLGSLSSREWLPPLQPLRHRPGSMVHGRCSSMMMMTMIPVRSSTCFSSRPVAVDCRRFRGGADHFISCRADFFFFARRRCVASTQSEHRTILTLSFLKHLAESNFVCLHNGTLVTRHFIDWFTPTKSGPSSQTNVNALSRESMFTTFLSLNKFNDKIQRTTMKVQRSH